MRLGYDARGRMTSHTDALGGVRTADYQRSRNIFTDERGFSTTYLFNSFAAVTQWRSPVQTINYLWDDSRLLQGADQPYRRLTYDARGNVLEDNSHINQRWTYDAGSDQPASYTDGARNTTLYAYDNRGNRVQSTDPAGNITRAEYDVAGQLVAATDPLNHTIRLAYDSFGNNTRQTDAMGFVSQFSHDARGHVTQATDAENHSISYTYDVMDRMTAATDALGRAMRTTYDANDNLTRAEDARGNASTLTYDALDRVTAETDPLGNATHYAYDAVGNLAQVTDARGMSVAYTYDAGNRRLSERYSDGDGIDYLYNTVSDLLSYEDGLTRATYVYTNAIPHRPDAITTELLAPGILSTVNYDYIVAVGATGAANAAASPSAADGIADRPDDTPAPRAEPDPIADPAAGQPPGNPEPDPIADPAAGQPPGNPDPDPIGDPAAGAAPGQDPPSAGQSYTAIPTATATDVCGAIGANTTWNLAGSPYRVTCDVTVNAGVTLTIAPGVVIKFNSYYDTLWVNGALIADGTAARRSPSPRSRTTPVGGDTNGDGGATQPAGNDWDSLRFGNSSAGSVLDHAVIRYGGGEWYENVYVATRDISITHSAITHSGQEGIRFDNVLPVTFTDNTFTANAGLPVWAPLSSNGHSLTISGNSASGHAVNGFAVAGSIAGQVTWDGDDGFPFVVWNDLAVNQNAKLTLTPGTVMKFNDYWDTLWVYGTLSADGTAAQPITFTSIKDDTAGGDTNGDGDATQPAGNDWDSLRFQNSSTGSVLDHAIVRYGGGEWYENVYVATRDISITHSAITHSGQEGIRFDNVLPAVFTANTFTANAGLPVWALLNNNSHSLAISGNSASGHAVNGFAVAGSIAGQVTWDGDDGFPFVVWNDLVVNGGAKLTLTPGTVMKFNDFYDALWVNGTLIAAGEQAQPITFTSIKDDTVGGDTNGSAAQPAGDDWDSLRFGNTSAGSVLDHAIVRYGGGEWYENVYVVTRDISITNTTIAYSGQEGIRFDNVLPATFTANTFTANAGLPVWALLNNNSHSLTISGNSASGHAVDGFAVAGSIAGQVTWDGDDGFPFVVWNDLAVNQNAKLTLTPGTVMKFNDYYDTLWVNGALIAEGEQAQPITFTSIKDDTAGGDTNGDGGESQPVGNDWDSLRFGSGSTGSVLDYVQVRYGGGEWYESVHIATAAITLTHSSIAHSGQSGLRISGVSPALDGNTFRDNLTGVWVEGNAAPVLRQNSFLGNRDYGLRNQGSQTIDAEDNWWGSVKGPYDPSNESGGLYNPDGDGDRVSDRVDYQPWLALTGLLYGITVATGSNPVQSLAFAYDELNRVTELSASGPVQTSYRYTYDAAGHLTAIGPAPGRPGPAAP